MLSAMPAETRILVTLPVAAPSGYLEWVDFVRRAQRALGMETERGTRGAADVWDPVTGDLLDQLGSQAYRASAVGLERVAPVVLLQPCRISLRRALRHLEWIERELEHRGSPPPPLVMDIRWMAALFVRRAVRRAVFSRAVHWLRDHAPGRSCPAWAPAAWEAARSGSPAARVPRGASA